MPLEPHFTDRVRRVLELAAEEAALRHRAEPDSSDILVGILREGGGVACAVLNRLGVSSTALASDLRTRLESEPPPGSASTSFAELIEAAGADAVALGHPSYLGTEHLLVAITRDRGPAGATLAAHGVTPATAAAMTATLLGRER